MNTAYPERFTQYMQFRKQILSALRSYLVPVIELKKDLNRCLTMPQKRKMKMKSDVAPDRRLAIEESQIGN